MKLLLFLCVTGVLLQSCTITKRTFRRGYHVEWRTFRNGQIHDQAGSIPDGSMYSDTGSRIATNTFEQTFEPVLVESYITPLDTDHLISDTEPEMNEHARSGVSALSKQPSNPAARLVRNVKQTMNIRDNSIPDEMPEQTPKIFITSWIGLLFTTLTVIAVLFAGVDLFASIVVAFFMFVGAVIFTLNALRVSNNNPDRYLTPWPSYIAVVVIALLIFLAFISIGMAI